MRHHGAGVAMATRLDDLGALRRGLSVDDAGTAIAVLTSHETYRQLVGDHGRSFDQCEEWLNQTLARLLL